MAQPVKKYYRYVFKFEVITDDPALEYEGLSLSDIDYICTYGHCSGAFLETEIKEITEQEVRNVLESQGSDSDFILDNSYQEVKELWKAE